MAADALRAGVMKVVSRVATGTRSGGMGTHKRKSGVRMAKTAAPAGLVDRMALTAVCGEARSPVIWRLGSFIICRMTTVAIGPDPDILVLLLIWMTCLAVGGQMCADKREGRSRMALGHVRNQPGFRSVTADAIRTQLAAVQIVVAAGALVFGPFEFEVRMTRAALHERMLPVEPETCGAMIELHWLDQFIP